jgi:hypothetical protein
MLGSDLRFPIWAGRTRRPSKGSSPLFENLAFKQSDQLAVRRGERPALALRADDSVVTFAIRPALHENSL